VPGWLILAAGVAISFFLSKGLAWFLIGRRIPD
jgi:hypothetical protein